MLSIEQWWDELTAGPMPAPSPTLGRKAMPPLVAEPHTCSSLHGLLGAVLDELDHGVLICEASGLVLAYNRCARQQLAQHPQLVLKGRQLQVGDGDHQGLQQAIKMATQGRRSLVALGDGSQRRYLGCSPLGPTGLALLLMGQTRGYSPVAFEMFCAQHQLTHAERRVLMGLIDGQRPVDMADAHGVALSTVRTQVAHIRAKLGAGRIEDLMQMAAGLPPLGSLLAGTAH